MHLSGPFKYLGKRLLRPLRVEVLWNRHLIAADLHRKGEIVGAVHAYGLQLGRDHYPTRIPKVLALLVVRPVAA